MSLAVFGESGSADEITRVVAIAPSRAWKAGDPVQGRPTAVHRHSTWLLRSPVTGDVSAEESLQGLLDLLPDKTAFQRLPSQLTVEVRVVIYGHGMQPGFWLSAASVQALSEIGASLDVDAYYLPAPLETD